MGIELVSISGSGTHGDRSSYEPSLSADGRYVAFVSDARNLVSGDSNASADIFVYDRQADSIQRVSVSSGNGQGDSDSYAPAISGDGRFVAFWSNAANLVSGDSNDTADIFVFDRQTGTTERVSLGGGGAQANGFSEGASISGNGRFVSFSSDADNFLSNDTNGSTDIFVYDRDNDSIERVSIATGGAQADGTSSASSISGSGRYVAFQSTATNLVAGDGNGVSDIFVYDRDSDAIERVSVSTAGTQGNGESSAAAISANGRYVVFQSTATNLVAGDSNGASDIFVYDRDSDTTTRVSLATGAGQANGGSYAASISADGRYVTFHSTASNLVTGDSNGAADVFVYDRQTGTTTRISTSDAGTQGNGASDNAVISGDGRHIAFDSNASNLVTGDSNGATSDVFVALRNALPAAQDDSLAVVAEDSGQRTIPFAALTGNDSDGDGDKLTVTAVGGAVGGTVSISGTDVLFTPAADFNGTASFTYTVADAYGGTATATASFGVTPVNDAPVAHDDVLSAVAENSGTRTIAFGELTGNDQDVDGDSLVVTAVTGATGGTVSLAGSISTGDARVLFTPDADFSGEASFTYTVNDLRGGTDTATVTFDVTPVNGPPTAQDDAFATVGGLAASGNVLNDNGNGADSDPDFDPLTVTAVDGESGNVGAYVEGSTGGLFSIQADGSLTFEPNGDYRDLARGETATSSVTYTVSDGSGTDTATATVTITGANHPPEARNDSLSAVLEDSGQRTIAFSTLTANDTDHDGDGLTVTSVRGAVGGTVSIVGSDVLFTPSADFNGTARFIYTVSDGFDETDSAVASFEVTAVNDAPAASDDTLSTVAEDSGQRTILSGTLLANDTDVDNQTLAITVVDDAVGGTVSLSGGDVLFTPTGNFTGEASFTYTVSDGDGGTDTATARFNVMPINDQPNAADDTLPAVAEDSGQRTIAFATLTANDDDPDGDELTIETVGGAYGGTVSISGSNVLFTPTANFNGTAAFAYKLIDGNGAFETAAVYFEVTAVNDVPVAQDDAFTVGEEGILTGRNIITNSGSADTDADGDMLTVVGVGAASGNVGTAVAGSNGGLFTIQADGGLGFATDGDFEALAAGQTAVTSIAYTVSDGHGGMDTATVTVTVTGADEAVIFTSGDDTRDLNAYNLGAFATADVTRALAGKDVVQLSQTQKLGVAFEAGAGNDTVTGSSSTDRIHGDGGKDWLQGQNGDDTLWGDAGDDTLAGGNGHDMLFGGAGSDTLTGGNGNDSFMFEDAGTEAITDFAFGISSGNKDVIDLRALHLADWTGSDSQITVTGSGNARTIHVDLDNDRNAANNTTQAEVVIYVNAGVGGLVRNFVISDTNPLADILV